MPTRRLKLICSKAPARGVEKNAARMFSSTATRKETAMKRMPSSVAWQPRIKFQNT
jgi:hypothetical protein